ncbi:hypothetical protein [Chamaesiphon minutus]|nr:hypothetical protein [Chamaesiphon minutus]
MLVNLASTSGEIVPNLADKSFFAVSSLPLASPLASPSAWSSLTRF